MERSIRVMSLASNNQSESNLKDITCSWLCSCTNAWMSRISVVESPPTTIKTIKTIKTQNKIKQTQYKHITNTIQTQSKHKTNTKQTQTQIQSHFQNMVRSILNSLNHNSHEIITFSRVEFAHCYCYYHYFVEWIWYWLALVWWYYWQQECEDWIWILFLQHFSIGSFWYWHSWT